MPLHSLPFPISSRMQLDALRNTDAAALADYFHGLSAESKSRFQPHPLTSEMAEQICADRGAKAIRLVLRRADAIVGYFILEPTMSAHEIARFAEHGIALETGQDMLFAPSIADAHQGQGLASLATPHVIAIARGHGARSLVLMGGTQSSNARAIAFYEKFGFERFGGYQSHVFNHDMRLWLEGTS